MGVRWRKYFPECKGKRAEDDRYGKVIQKGVDCEGKKGKHCPQGIPKDRPCGQWAVEFRDQHGIWRSIIKPGFTKTVAQEAYNETIRNIQRGLFNLPVLQKMPKATVEAYSKKYLEHIKKIVPENTFVSRQTAVNAIIRHLGCFEVSRLNIILIQRFCTDIMQKDAVKASTVNQYCSILRLIVDMAVKEGIISNNPMKEFVRLRVGETSKRVLTDEEIKTILNESTLPMGWERMAILIGFFVGLRLMDTIALKWASINFHNSTITITAQKTGRVIVLPLSSYLVGELRKYKALLNIEKDYLFYDGEVTHLTETKFSKHFVNLFRKLGIQDFSFHNLRHTNATKVVEIIQDVSIASKMLGHTNLNTTMTYLHQNMDTKKEAVEKFTNHMLSLAEYEPEAKQKTA